MISPTDGNQAEGSENIRKPMFFKPRAKKNQWFLRKINVFEVEGSEKQFFPNENKCFSGPGLRKANYS